jgi:hypothetical protein
MITVGSGALVAAGVAAWHADRMKEMATSRDVTAGDSFDIGLSNRLKAPVDGSGGSVTDYFIVPFIIMKEYISI